MGCFYRTFTNKMHNNLDEVRDFIIEASHELISKQVRITALLSILSERT